jgi:transglutaminase superfamily protein
VFRSKALRPIAGVVLVTFTALTLQPLTAAAQLPSAPKREQRSDSGEERYSRLLKEIHEILKEVVPATAMPHRQRTAAPEIPGKPGGKVLQAVGPKLLLESERAKPLPGVDVAAKVKTLRGKYKELKGLESAVADGFKATEKHIRDAKLPAEILARQEEAVAQYEKRKGEFDALMRSVESAADGQGSLQAALSDLGAFMAKYPNEKTHTPTDPNNLPWGSPKPVTRAPYTSPSQFKTSRLFGEPVKVAQAGSLSGIGLPSTVLPVTPNAGDLAATEDAQITQAIRDLATSLGNKPVPIYNWVRNNIAFIPSYGSIQGSDMTLQTRRGNAFDTASLFIALLRAANIPARYVYGTIEVPADKAMNWVGGVTVPQAAMNLMGQGGIPVIGVTRGGQIGAIRLEHVWVEAYVDYTPSRGAVNRNANTWVPLDASFKQYQFTQGMDIKTNVPFDANSLITQTQVGATVNDAEGWVQNLNQAVVQQTVANYQAQITSYVKAQKPNAVLSDVLGMQTISQETRPILLGTLPYARIATGAKFQALPDNLRWKFRYNLYASDTDRAYDSPFVSYTQSTASLAGKKITLSYSPATAADQNAINGLLPQPHADGTPIQRSEFPQSLPGYLIRLVPQLGVEGQLVAAGPPFSMGSELVENEAYFNPANGQWEGGEDNRPIVGEYSATTLDLQGVSEAQVTALLSRLQATQASLNQFQLNPGDITPLQNLTKESVTGDLLYAGVLSYFGNVDANDKIAERLHGGVVTYRFPSYGRVFAVGQPRFFFGIARSISFPSLAVDVDFLRVQAEAKNEDRAARLSFMRQIGAAGSAAEHAVPEQLFGDPSIPAGDPAQPQAISAVKALAIAASQGQRIYTFNSQNQATQAGTLAGLGISADAKAEIANALAMGKEVTVHQTDINAFGFSGAGYIIIDPETGSGAYKVDGGANGAIFVTWLLFVLVGLAIAAAFAAGFTVAAAIAGALLLANIIMLVTSISKLSNDQQFMDAHAFAALAALTALLGLLFLPAGIAVSFMFFIPAIWILVFRWGEFPPGWLLWLVHWMQ